VVAESQAAHSVNTQETLNPEEFLTFKLLKFEFLVNTRLLIFGFKVAIKTIVIKIKTIVITIKTIVITIDDGHYNKNNSHVLHGCSKPRRQLSASLQ